MAPHIVAFVFAKTVPIANIMSSVRRARIGAFREVPRTCTALASYGGSCEHGYNGDACCRRKFRL